MVVQGNHDSEGRAIYREHTSKDEAYQKWNIVYVDEAGNMKDKIAREWGMEPDRPFHIISG